MAVVGGKRYFFGPLFVENGCYKVVFAVKVGPEIPEKVVFGHTKLVQNIA